MEIHCVPSAHKLLDLRSNLEERQVSPGLPSAPALAWRPPSSDPFDPARISFGEEPKAPEVTFARLAYRASAGGTEGGASRRVSVRRKRIAETRSTPAALAGGCLDAGEAAGEALVAGISSAAADPRRPDAEHFLADSLSSGSPRPSSHFPVQDAGSEATSLVARGPSQDLPGTRLDGTLGPRPQPPAAAGASGLGPPSPWGDRSVPELGGDLKPVVLTSTPWLRARLRGWD
ncbi:uncharacterized protein [Symphalangus syndactylus]|uniref:uncharacterized protein n=1 Tax=Symphalangus syndactylus TaxID=9590 RepID=UPI003007B079